LVVGEWVEKYLISALLVLGATRPRVGIGCEEKESS